MKKILMVLALTACGTDETTTTTTTPAAKPVAPVAVKTAKEQEAEAKAFNDANGFGIPTPSAVVAPVVAPTPVVVPVDPLDAPKNYKVTFNFKYTIRRAPVTADRCLSDIWSILNEDQGYNSGWICNGEPLAAPDQNYFIASNASSSVVKMTIKENYDSLLIKPDCRIVGTRELKCDLTSNYVEVFANNVTNRDETIVINYWQEFKTYTNVTWKVYYIPTLNF